MSCGNAGGGRAGGGGGQQTAAEEIQQIQQGETPLIEFSRSGQPVVVETQDGGLKYLGHVPKSDDITPDKNSTAYKLAMHDMNTKITIGTDGKVVATGGMYRKKTFKNFSEFERDVNQRIAKRRREAYEEIQRVSRGRITQIEAELFRGIVRNNSSSVALKKMSAEIKSRMQAAVDRYQAAEDAANKVRSIRIQRYGH